MNKDILNSIGLLILRLSFGCFMLVHGWDKFATFTEKAEVFPDPLGMGSQMSLISAIGAELGCSIFLILGLGTRLFSLPLAFTMIVALFIVHGGEPWKKQELAACYLAVYVAILFLGPGKFSLDYWLFGRKNDLENAAVTKVDSDNS